MRYGVGECLADYGFGFLEKIHEPIFLVNHSGFLVKINEAGRKFIRVAQLTQKELDLFFKSAILGLLQGSKESYRRLPLGNGCQAIARNFAGSDLVMIEIVR